MMVSRSRIASILVLTIATYLASGHVISREHDPDSKVGDPCTDGSDCYGNTECSTNVGPGYCTCKAGFEPDDTLNCVVGAEVVGGPCRSGVGCEQIHHTECSSTSTEVGKCKCSSGFQGEDGSTTCYQAAEVVGGPCSNGFGCEHIPNSDCSSRSSEVGICICLAGFHGEDGGTTCTQDPESKVGDVCIDGSGCNGNMECTSKTGSGFCTCIDGYHADETLICVAGAEVVGGPCINGVGCEHIPNSDCSSSSSEEGICKCLAGFHGEDGGTTCTQDPESKVGDVCIDGSGCNGNMECTSKTGSGFCTCIDGYHADETLICVAGAEVVGGPCINGVGCEHIPNSDCSSSSSEEGICKCLAGFHGEDGGTTCTQDPESKVGDVCIDGSGCNGNMECTSKTGSGFCTCIDGYHADETLICVAGAEVVGGPCINGFGCEHIPNSDCSSSSSEEGICKCLAGFHGEDGSTTCTQDPEESKLGDICTDASGCYGNTECNSKDGPGFCTCKTGYHADGALNCVAGDAIIGSACNHNLGCEKVPGLKCNGTDDQGKCTCNDGFHADGEGRNCVQDVGSPCNPSVGCFDPAAECKMNQMGDYTCQCREGFEAVGNICKRMDSGLHIRVHVEEAKDIDIEIDKF
ncbi:cell death abnormality protein 1-like isoform X1 [Ischnura elegans]|uniref:cell death abnormality protein 1-like isoform X1 n=1 Tax=Ischnura elegans TaxID=197161 RepID=UPI001ED8896A|nr:cell death abnormality protein 1-like isoform X1 [Ischnura elegans]